MTEDDGELWALFVAMQRAARSPGEPLSWEYLTALEMLDEATVRASLLEACGS